MTSTDMPVVSVITIFLNGREFIEEAIASLFAQEYQNWELLLVDDGSTDGITEYARQLAAAHPDRIRYLEHSNHQNRGMSASRNLAIAHAKGDYLAFLDADDAWLPHKLRDQVALLESNPEAGMVYGSTLWWYSWTGAPADAQRDYRDFVERRRGIHPNSLFSPPTLFTAFLQDGGAVPCNCSILVRRSVVERVGGFEEEFRGMFEDQAFLMKVALSEPIFVADGCWAKYRQHDRSCCAEVHRDDRFHAARLFLLTWIEGYLKKRRITDAALWQVLTKQLRTYRFPTAPAAIDGVSLAPLNLNLLRGCNLEVPAAGAVLNGHTIELIGWVLGRQAPASAVELLLGDTVIQTIPIDVPRADVAAVFPDLPHAELSGFRTTVEIVGVAGFELRLRAILPENTADIGSLTVRRLADPEDFAWAAETVSVVITCGDHATYLPDAIESVLSQGYPSCELLVADYSLIANVAAVTARYPGVRYLRSSTTTQVAARNEALAQSTGSYILFLQADDRLVPDALSNALREIQKRPAAAFAAGKYRHIAFNGAPLPTACPPKSEDDTYLALLRDNFLPVESALLFRTACLSAEGGFHPSSAPIEIYEACLRLARRYPAALFDTIIAEQRQHGDLHRTSAAAMLKVIGDVLDSQLPFLTTPQQLRCAEEGLRKARADHFQAFRREFRAARKRADRPAVLPDTPLFLRHFRAARKERIPSLGTIRFGDFSAATPLGHCPRSDRSAVEQVYLRNFLEDSAAALRGRVLEISDLPFEHSSDGVENWETVPASDLAKLSSSPDLLAFLGQWPRSSFDCVIASNLLNRVYHPEVCLAALFDLLKRSGILLATFPGVHPKRAEWGESSLWGFTHLSARRLFEETLPSAQVEVSPRGNILSVSALLHNLPASILEPHELDFRDPAYEAIVTVRARRSSGDPIPASRPAPASPTVNLHLPRPLIAQPLILLYHRVTPLASDPWNLAVSPVHFEEHLQVLREYSRPAPLRELANQNDALPSNTAIITFDDGYADNLYNGKPLLERYEMPATFFLTTDLLGSAAEFWWDELERLILLPTTIPDFLRLTINGSSFEWTGEAGLSLPSRELRTQWRAGQPPLSSRYQLYTELYRRIHPLPLAERESLLQELRIWSAAKPAGRASHRLLTPDEVLDLASGSLFEIGGHTLSHPNLASLSLRFQEGEIRRGQERLEELLGSPLHSFAYPYGDRHNFTADTVRLVRESGFRCACAAFPETINSTSDPFALPRCFVADSNGDEFARQLRQWSSGSSAQTGQS